MNMERTVLPENAPQEKIIYDVQNEPIVVSKALIDLLLKEDITFGLLGKAGPFLS